MPACAGICVLAERGAAECGLESRARCGSRYRPTFPDRSSVGGVRTRAHDAKTGRKIDLYIPNPEAPDGGPAQATHAFLGFCFEVDLIKAHVAAVTLHGRAIPAEQAHLQCACGPFLNA